MSQVEETSNKRNTFTIEITRDYFKKQKRPIIKIYYRNVIIHGTFIILFTTILCKTTNVVIKMIIVTIVCRRHASNVP